MSSLDAEMRHSRERRRRRARLRRRGLALSRSARCRCRPTSGATRRDAADAERYQTVFARSPGAVAAPTAGLHLTRALLRRARGARRRDAPTSCCTSGPAPSARCRAEDLARGRLHAERFELSDATAAAVRRARAARRARRRRRHDHAPACSRVVRAGRRGCRPGAGETDLLLAPGARFRVGRRAAHQLPPAPLVAAAARRRASPGRERVLAAYAEAIERGLPLLLLRRRDADPVS